MIKRFQSQIAFSPESGRQMRFIAGPRQSGKTTMVKSFLDECCGSRNLYYNWDRRDVRSSYLKDSLFFLKDLSSSRKSEGKYWVVMDEIHKYPKWKNVLKGMFDASEDQCRLIVTGSARLDLFRKSGDSLAGRYFLFHLSPVSLNELAGSATLMDPPDTSLEFIRRKMDTTPMAEDFVKHLLQFSGFPEPLLTANDRFHRRWQASYIDRLISEDLRSLSRIHEMEQVAGVIQLLPERIGSPLSINSLARDLFSNHPTVSRYITALELVYVVFGIKPFARSIARSLTKESKVYFYDWTRVMETGKRFENYIAMELKTIADIWTDSGVAAFELRYLRDRDGKETDFLLLRDRKPWLLVEVKSARSAIEYHHLKNRDILGPDTAFVQITAQEGVAERHDNRAFQISASRFLA